MSRSSASVVAGFSVAGGAGAALVSRLVGSLVRLAVGLPFLPSILVGVPRGTLLLSGLGAVNRFGALTLMGAVEGLALVGMGAPFPFGFVCPAFSALLADVAYLLLRRRVAERTLLSAVGAVLNTSRPLTAMGLALFLGLPHTGGRGAVPAWVVLGVLALNALAGILAGQLAGGVLAGVRKLGVRHEHAHG